MERTVKYCDICGRDLSNLESVSLEGVKHTYEWIVGRNWFNKGVQYDICKDCLNEIRERVRSREC